MRSLLILSLLVFVQSHVSSYGRASSNSSSGVLSGLVSIPDEYTYFIPGDWSSNLEYSFVNGTTTSNSSLNELFHAASQSPFISYDPQFDSIFGSHPEAVPVPCPASSPINSSACAFEAGIWVPETNEVWLSSASYYYPKRGGLSILDLATNTLRPANLSAAVPYPNGGTYFQGKIWLGTFPENNNASTSGNPATVITIDPHTHQVEPILNSYFGLPLLSADDLAWASQGNNNYLFFTMPDFSVFGIDVPAASLPNAVWRWDPATRVLRPVIDRVDVNSPNGVRITRDQRSMYITDSNSTMQGGAGNGITGASPSIYRFALDDEGLPYKKQLFSIARTGIPDGLHVDDAGRVWSGETEGIVIRDGKTAKVLGVVNAQVLAPKQSDNPPLANFAIAGDKLIVGGFDKAWIIQLNQTVIAANSSVVD